MGGSTLDSTFVAPEGVLDCGVLFIFDIYKFMLRPNIIHHVVGDRE